MGKIVIMPKQGLQMTEGMISSWLFQEGDTVKEGEPLFEMETDKLAITIDAPASGTLLKILCPEGETAEVAAPIAVIGEPGADYAAILAGDPDSAGEATTASTLAPVSADTELHNTSPMEGHIVIMPKQGLQMTEGMISSWLFQEGDTVKEGEPLFDMETDKLAITIDAPASGTLLKILCPEGETAEVATPIAVIGPAGADYQTILTGNPDKLTVSAPAETTPLSEETRSFSSPRARMRARELGVDYHTITGSGPMGMIIERDVLGAVTQSNTATAATILTPDTSVTPVRGEHQIPVTNMRRIIAQRMVDSLNTLAQANHRLTVDMTEAVRLREQLKAADVKISYNDIVIRCTAKALIEFPMMNATMDDSFITTKDYVNIGMAVATDTGLLVPVIHDADLKSLPEISAISHDLATRTKENRLSPDEMSGGTFTISNLGMFDIESFTAIVNKPEVGILAVGKMEKKPAVVNDQLVIRPLMQLSLTYDHRVVDGAPAALFLRRIKQLLENPGLLI